MINSRQGQQGRSWLRLRQLYPAIIGISLGFAFSMFYIPVTVVEEQCVLDMQVAQVHDIKIHPTKKVKREEKIVIGATVKPKLSKYGPSFRPYYVASEITQRERLLVGVLASEFNLESLGTAINNTWLPDLPRVVLYLPYSKDPDFHEKYNKVLGLPIIQLAGAEEDHSSSTQVTFKMLEHMHKNYLDKYDWFMRVEEATYLEPSRLIKLVNMINSSMNVYVGLPAPYSATSDYRPTDLYNADRYCQGQPGVILSRVTLGAIVPHLDSCLEQKITDEEDLELGRCLNRHLNLHCTWNYEVSNSAWFDSLHDLHLQSILVAMYTQVFLLDILTNFLLPSVLSPQNLCGSELMQSCLKNRLPGLLMVEKPFLHHG